MSHRPAFALPSLLLLASLCLAVACLCLASARLAGTAADVSLRRQRCQLTALASARLGVGMVAQALGPDARWSGQDASGAAWWARRADDVWVLGSLAGRARDLGDAELAWRVRDQSCGCDAASAVLARDRASSVARKPRMRQRLAAGATQPDPGASVLSSARVLDLAGVRAGRPSDLPDTAYSAGTRSLLVNPATGEWRTNLSVPASLASRMGEALAVALLSPASSLRDQPVRGMEPVDISGASVRLRHMPVLTDIALSMGVFNARSDGRHRVRMHAQMTLWNPDSLGLITRADKRLFLAELEGAPEVTVTNLDSGASFTTWLDRSPPGVFWGYTQGVRERGLWWWVEVLDATRHGMLRSGLLPGEVYALRMPDPVAQPYGLARVLGGSTWRFDDTEHPAGWVRPSPEVFLPKDRIVVAMRFVTQGTTLRLHPYVGALDAGTEAADYPSPALLSLSHVAWPDARLEMSGAEYSRVDSNGYVIGERRFCWRARLLADSDADVYALAADPVFMSGRIDLADPAQRSRWLLTSDAVAEAAGPVDSPGSPMFRDGAVNRHDALVDGAFADWRLRDVPIDPPLDVASLRLLQGATPASWLPDLDRVFFACPDPATELPVSENPRLVPWRTPGDAVEVAAQREALLGERAGELLALEGAFNVNNTDPMAWEALLTSDPLHWVADTGGPALPGKLEAVAGFFSQPTGAMLAKYASSNPCDLSDAALAALGAAARSEVARRQSVRVPDTEALRRFCQRLVDEIARRGEPFVGVSDFVRSGVVDRAIIASKLNEGLPAGSPASLDAMSLLGAHVALLVARGDTFAVVGEGRVGGGFMALELTVQRLPEPASRPHLGRRFVVIKARWLDAPSR